MVYMVYTRGQENHENMVIEDQIPISSWYAQVLSLPLSALLVASEPSLSQGPGLWPSHLCWTHS